MKKTTIYDIAEACNCSPATVSLALNGDSRVNKETSEFICRMSDKLGYQANYFGKGLIKGKANTIMMVIPDMYNPIFPTMVDGVQTALKKTDYHLLLEVTNNNLQKELKSIDNLLDKKVDGIIISPMYEKELTQHIMGSEADMNRIVYLGFPCLSTDKIQYVETNSRLGAFEGVTHLINQGCKKIAFVMPVVAEGQGSRRMQGYKDALESGGIAFDNRLVFRCGQRFDVIYDCAFDLLRNEKPDGIFCLYDFAALPIFRAAKALNIKVPDQLKIVGYDNIDIGMYFPKSLTTIETYQREQGKLSAQILLSLLKGNKEKVANIVNPVLLKREST